ncbi:MAG: ornithine cyclodeaminase family protein [Syntrophus sp. (in: bacteria)]|nr:ornithine cyclodeaminase family protein [Syntrophus sp. (in: bacteria)]
MKTLIITKREIEEVLTPSVANRTVEKAFKAYGLGQADMPAKSYLYFENGDLRSMPAYIHGQGFDIAGIKSVTVHPENARYNLPAVMAVIILTDPKTGFPLAIMDGTYLTGIRTGASGAVAAKYLSRKSSRTAGFVGCGVQARTQLACTLEVRKLKTVKIWQFTPEDRYAPAFKKWVEKTYKLETIISPDIDEITTGVDILFTTTPAHEALVHKVSPGTHINAIGADAQGKQEIDYKILKQARIVIDDWAQASHSGEINVPLRRKQLTKKDIYAGLGDIVAGTQKGRASKEEITLFDSTGLAIQDVSCAWVVYQALKDKPGIRQVALY